MMKVDVSSRLECPADKAWAEVQKPSLLVHVSHPLVRLVCADPGGFPPVWREGEAVRFHMYLLCFLPFGTRTLFTERIDHDRRRIQTREKDPMIRRWDHLISIEPASSGACVYRDEIEIDAGILTLPVWLWAAWFYRHRQKRWRALARGL